jgi:hypothetical protein
LFERKVEQKKQTNLQFERLCGVLCIHHASYPSIFRRIGAWRELLWNSEAHAMDCGGDFSIFFARAHDKKCRLGKMYSIKNQSK